MASAEAQKKEANLLKEEGNKAYKAKDFAAALAAYTAASELDPDDITYAINSAAVHFEQGDLAQCINTCTAAIAKGREVFAPFPLIAKAFFRIGNAHAKAGDLRAAIEAYESSLAEANK